MSDERDNLSMGAEGHSEHGESSLPLAGAVASASVFRSTSVESGHRSESDSLVNKSNKDSDDDNDSYLKHDDDDDDHDDKKKRDDRDEKKGQNDREKEKDVQADKKEDNPDGIYVRSSSSKPRTNTETRDEEQDNCDKYIIDCLYYSMQCCQCTIM